MNMMSACIMVPWVQLLLALLLSTGEASDIVSCPTFWYMSNGTCYACPETCRVCFSDTNCTLCERGFYGPVCENRCGEGCTGTCHKFFGHCTYGCPDGEYPEEGNGCRICPLNCTLCESPNKCAVCEAGYFGARCQERCPEHCTACNKTTGQCLQCNESYFKYEGLCSSCPYGCRTCNSTDNCHACEEGFYGPVDGGCIFKCPGAGERSYFLPAKDGRCGFWQDTNHNICDGQSKSRSCTSSGNCIQDIDNCNLSDQCVTNMSIEARCGKVMQYKCKHECARIASRYGCVETCTVLTITSDDTSILCLDNNAVIETQTFQKHVDCNHIENKTSTMSETVPGAGHNSNTMNYGIAIALLAIFIALVIVVVMLYHSIRQEKQKEKV